MLRKISQPVKLLAALPVDRNGKEVVKIKLWVILKMSLQVQKAKNA